MSKIDKYIKEVPLDIRLRIVNEMFFIDLLTELGYREDKKWSTVEDGVLEKVSLFAKKLSNEQIKEFNRTNNK